MRYPVKTTAPMNQCHECGTEIRAPKRFCSEECIVRWSRGSNLKLDPRGCAQVERSRRESV
jgi:hypothetical protein